VDEVYRNKRFRRVRFLQVAFWGATAALVALTGAAGDDERRGARIAAALAIAAVPALCALGIEVYMRCYVTALRRSADAVEIETLSTFGRTTRRYPAAQVTGGPARRSDPLLSAATTGFALDNSWSTVRVAGRRLPFIVDTTA
jgi:hypothetical protein